MASAGTNNLNRMLQLTGLSDPVYAEAYVTVHQYDIVLDVTVINRSNETLQNLCLELATMGDLKLVERPQVRRMHACTGSVRVHARCLQGLHAKRGWCEPLCAPVTEPQLCVRACLKAPPLGHPQLPWHAHACTAWHYATACLRGIYHIASTSSHAHAHAGRQGSTARNCAAFLRFVCCPQNHTLAPGDSKVIRANIKVSSTETGVIFGNIVYEGTGYAERSVVVLNDIHIDIMDYISPAHCADVQFRNMWAEFEWENKVSVNTTITDVNLFLQHIIGTTNMKCLTPPSALEGE